MRTLSLMVIVLVVGCTKNEVEISDCVRSAIATEDYWEERSLRWLNAPSTYRIEIDQSALDSVAHNFVTNIAKRFKCAVPLFIKFTKDCSLKENRSAGRLFDVRNNTDYPYCLEAILWGNESAVLCNRLYFCHKNECTNQVVVWSRRLDNIHAWYSPYPRVGKRLMDDIGVVDIRRRGLSPLFLGDEEYGVERFLKRVIDGNATLYWWCGQWGGLCEGKHIYDSVMFEKWIENNRCFVIPMHVIFSAGNTFIFSVDSMQK